MKSYRETLDWLYTQLPMYQRTGAFVGKIDLQKTQDLMALLDHPEKRPCLHVAGTNGKGSVSHMMAAILQHSRYRTGLYTSPHLVDFRERIRIDGAMIPASYVQEFVHRYHPDFQQLGLSFFEMTVGLALDYFRQQKTDVNVLEVGLGGRLDSTNIVKPELSIITHIGFDHMDFLGHTLDAIAREKAGIIKPGVPVLIGRKQAETEEVFAQAARDNGAPLYYAEDLLPNPPENLNLDLAGHYQKENARTALAAAELLTRQGFSIRSPLAPALEQVIPRTGLRGRWEILQHAPLTIADTAHNEGAIATVMEQIREQSYRQLHLVWGMVRDKDLSAILPLLPIEAQFYFCAPDVPRALPAPELQQAAQAYHLQGTSYPRVADAYRAAQQQAGDQDLIYVGGSTFTVAEVLPPALVSAPE